MDMNMNMDIEELNRQMQYFQNDYSQNQNQHQNQNINFPQPLDIPLPTTQIKRPTRTTGTHRNEINDKMTQMKMNQPMMTAPNQFLTQIPVLAQPTRNNFQYQNQTYQNLPNLETSIENLPHLLKKHYQQEQENPLSAYFQQNYSTLNGIQQPQKQQQQFAQSSLEQFNIPTNMQQHTLAQNTHRQTHGGGQSFVNPNNINSFTQSPIQSLSQEQQPGNGFHRTDEKRIDYRQNMNSAVGNFIFDNPNAARYNPQQVAYNPNGYARDTRMVIQDSSKDIYRQEANSRMAQYSPLARASHVPINIANMSVNDFYANMNPANQSQQQQYQTVEEDARAILNARLGEYSPLAKVTPLEKPKSWQDNNVNRANPLVAHDELPIISH